MARKTLTDRFVRSVKVQRRENYFDEKVRGLCLRVGPTGAKSWNFVYRISGGKNSQWQRLGSHPAIALDEARKLALAARHANEVEKGDPVRAKVAKAATTQPRQRSGRKSEALFAHNERGDVNERLLTQPEVTSRLTLSRATIWRYVRAGNFPQPIKLGPRRVAWRESEILRWLNERSA